VTRPIPSMISILALLAVTFAAAPGCKKHEDFPQPLGVTAPPKVINLSVTTPDNVDFDLMWDIADPTGVQAYRIYFGIEGLGEPEFDSEWTNPCPCTVPVSLPLPVTNTVWGVSVVTDDNVEGAMVTFVVQ